MNDPSPSSLVLASDKAAATSAALDQTPAPRRFRRERRLEQRVKVMGQPVDLVTPDEVFHFAAARIASRQPTVIANHNLHSLHLAQRSKAVRDFYRTADLIELDSVPLVFWARLMGLPARRFHRCTYLDWRDQFWRRAVAESWRVYFVGGEPGVAEAAAEVIREKWPQVALQTHHGFFDAGADSAENQAVTAKINAFAPDVLLVGMGMPRQELWVAENRARLAPCVIFTVGGAFDYEAGAQAAAPRWMGSLGLEWAFRLAADPRRLFTRYCMEPWSLIAPALGDVGEGVARGVGPILRPSRHGKGEWAGRRFVSAPSSRGPGALDE
jgi:N-acetylglucosaminyldiphosphoundecaprenol N-acetyl-beta-D-mannosaminyltransferase